jgi:heptosyltransferase III
MKILLVKFRNIGDVLLTTPLIANLKNNFPDAQIDFSVNKGTESMLTLNPNLNDIFVYDRQIIKSYPLLKRLWREVQFIKSFKKKDYNIVINLTDGDRGNLIAWFSNAPLRIGYKNNNLFFKKSITHELPEQKLRHTVEQSLDPLKALNLSISNRSVEIYWSKEDEKLIDQKLVNVDNFIHIHPVSRWLFKCISDSTMSKIIDYCELELGLKVVLTASKDKFEINKINNILSHTKSNPINFAGKFSLKQTATLNKKAKIFIGVDTSIMHVSAANNTPVLAFFGPSGACHWGPWDNTKTESGYTEINGHQVMGMHRVFSESRACQPCGKDGCSGSKVSDCLMSLDFEKIKSNIKDMLNEQDN